MRYEELIKLTRHERRRLRRKRKMTARQQKKILGKGGRRG